MILLQWTRPPGDIMYAKTKNTQTWNERRVTFLQYIFSRQNWFFMENKQDVHVWENSTAIRKYLASIIMISTGE